MLNILYYTLGVIPKNLGGTYMSEENYIIENETTDTIKKKEYQETGIGLNKVDNLEPSKHLLELSKENINGNLKYYEVKNLLKKYYKEQNSNNIKIQEEKDFDYSKLNTDELIKHISKFTSSIWQVHPFGEGNTRTTAVFIEKYLNNMGFSINNDMFKENSLYFKNALVRSNYGNIPKGIYPTFDYLIMFFENLLQNKNNELKNKDLCVEEIFKNNI